MRALIICVLLLFSLPGEASVSRDLKGFFNKMGSNTNVSGPGVYGDQAAGYATGGRLFVRNQVRNVSPLVMQMPSLRAGCGGIDMYMGGLSFIRSKELLSALKKIGQNVASYGFMLAIQTVSPQIYNTLNQLNKLAQDINQFNINSCEAAATALGGVWPRTDQTSRHLCASMGTSMGQFSDWAQARQNCGAGRKYDQVMSRKSSQSAFKNMLTPPFNLVWHALKEREFLSRNKALAELFLSLSGTLIVRKGPTDEEPQVIRLPSLVRDGSIIETLLRGGEAKVYKCRDGEDCLDPQMGTLRLTSGLEQKVNKTLDSILEKIEEDVELDASEADFLNRTKLPVYKMLNVASAFRRGMSPLDVHEYAQLISFDMVLQYLEEMLEVVTRSVHELKEVQLDDKMINQFLKDLRHVRSEVAKKRHEVLQYLHTTVSLLEKTKLLEQQLHVMTSTTLDRDG